MMSKPAIRSGPRVRSFGAVNWLGLWTLYTKEVRRFLKVFTQTVLAPVVSTLLFLAIFALALGGVAKDIGGVPYVEFLAPGLVMAAVMQQAFANNASSLLSGKIQGNIVDVLMPPLSPAELTAGFALGGMTRGLCVAAATVVAIEVFVPFRLADPLAVGFFLVSGALLMSLLGALAGIWAEKFDHVAAVTNFVVMPLAFLSGTFYSVESLPLFWRSLAYANPFFYMIDGFRAGFIGHAEGALDIGYAVVTGACAALWAIAHILFKRGYNLRA
ncbi:MAG: ABC transporter permease [Alphaproteobacteria bacterium]